MFGWEVRASKPDAKRCELPPTHTRSHSPPTQQPDLFTELPAFRTYARRGLDVELSFAKAADLSAADAKAVFDLCKVREWVGWPAG